MIFIYLLLQVANWYHNCCSLQNTPSCCEMDRGQNGRDDFFGGRDPFAGFGGFGPQRSLISGFFGGRDPFDDPFFTQPFGGRMMGGPGMFGPSPFGPMGGPFGGMNDRFIDQAPPPRSNSRRPVITELDEEGENTEHGNEQSNQDSYVQEPDDASDGRSRVDSVYLSSFKWMLHESYVEVTYFGLLLCRDGRWSSPAAEGSQ